MAAFDNAFFPGGAVITLLQLSVLTIWVYGWWQQFQSSGDDVNVGEITALVIFGTAALVVSAVFLHGTRAFLKAASLPARIIP